MKVSELADYISLEWVAGKHAGEKKVKGVYIGDVLSCVLSKAQEGDAWITVQSHINIIAVAHLLMVSCIIITETAFVDKLTLSKADEEGIAIFQTTVTSYQVARQFAILLTREDLSI